MIVWIKAKLPTEGMRCPLMLDEALDKGASSYRQKINNTFLTYGRDHVMLLL